MDDMNDTEEKPTKTTTPVNKTVVNKKKKFEPEKSSDEEKPKSGLIRRKIKKLNGRLAHV